MSTSVGNSTINHSLIHVQSQQTNPQTNKPSENAIKQQGALGATLVVDREKDETEKRRRFMKFGVEKGNRAQKRGMVAALQKPSAPKKA